VIALRACIAALAACLALTAPALAEKSAKGDSSSAFGNIGGGGKDPIKIDADRLDVFDKENKAVFAGNVVAVQGESTIRCTTMTVYYKRGKETGAKDKAAEGGDESAPANPAQNGIKKVDCAGPVTVTQKDQVATGDSAVFDQDAKRIVLTGNVVLSQCQNVTRGQRLVYDMSTGRANMDPVAGGRVSAMFVPGEKSDGKDSKKGCSVPPAKPRAQAN
jgi:lipopolysaccharide export system protein LptA